MPIIIDVLYREFCRARLAKMRKQLLLWPGVPVVPEANCEAGHPDDAADITLGSSQDSSPNEWTSRKLSRAKPTSRLNVWDSDFDPKGDIQWNCERHTS